MSELTKEWLQKTIAELEEERDAVPGVVNEDAAMSLAAMKIALASLEAEPVISHLGSKNALDAIVAFIKSNRNPTLKDYNEVSERLFHDNCHGLSNHVIEYIKRIGEELEELRSTQDTAPPAPVVTDEQRAMLRDMDDEIVAELEEEERICRAAMLQGAEPVSNRDELPEGWVACSERMPERDYVLAADFSGKQYPANLPNIQIGIYADWFDDGCPCWDDGDGNDLHLKQVTHWAQIPAAPQQEVK